LRMRVALHAGDVLRDDQGWVGAELNTACRLVDLPALRNALAQVPSARLAVVVSDIWFKTVVRHDPGTVDHRNYTRVPIAMKEPDHWAWIYVPGHPKPSIPSMTDPTDASAINFSGPIRANTIVGRDQINPYIGATTPRQDRR
jgi:hypothetical protein